MNEAGKAYLAFENKVWKEMGENNTFQRYSFTVKECNGIAFSVTQVEIVLEGKSGTPRSMKLGESDLRAASVDPDIVPYGDMTIDGGFPEGEFLRGGIVVYGNDANGEAMTFTSLIEF